MALARGILRPLCRPGPTRMGSLCRQPVRLGQRRHLCSAAEAPVAKAPSGFTQWCAANPIKFGVGVATVKTAAADLLTQKAIEGKAWDSIDWRRNGLFTVFGFAYQGAAHGRR